MTKAQALETIRDAQRRLRIERDSGNDALTDQILNLNMLIDKIKRADKTQLAVLVDQHGLNN